MGGRGGEGGESEIVDGYCLECKVVWEHKRFQDCSLFPILLLFLLVSR
jgi:hypothetical protein